MGKGKYYQYYVEGADEEKLINVMKSQMCLICPGKVENLNQCFQVKKVICIPQVENLEDELLRSCDIRQIRELTGSKSNKDYKHALVIEKNLAVKLESKNFDISKFWIKNPSNLFSGILNESQEIKLK
ncbi:MAG: hypothetical protein K2N81_11075 [Acetatifactor sp.]|nr:hypothetical protein [Acetatifactor sp.]